MNTRIFDQIISTTAKAKNSTLIQHLIVILTAGLVFLFRVRGLYTTYGIIFMKEVIHSSTHGFYLGMLTLYLNQESLFGMRLFSIQLKMHLLFLKPCSATCG